MSIGVSMICEKCGNKIELRRFLLTGTCRLCRGRATVGSGVRFVRFILLAAGLIFIGENETLRQVGIWVRLASALVLVLLVDLLSYAYVYRSRASDPTSPDGA